MDCKENTAAMIGYLQDNAQELRKKIETTRAQWDSFLKKLEVQKDRGHKDYYEEQVWTFLIAAGFASTGVQGIRKLAHILTGCTDLEIGEEDKIWLEALPYPPRYKEGNTNLDMALGRISPSELDEGETHSETKGNGIKYGGDGGFICFCEMKWYSDISKDVTHDKHRNQLVRVIDNALMFEDEEDMLPERIFVTLVTPKVFKERKPKSRLYAYKFEEYANERAILEDLEGCRLLYRPKPERKKEKEEKVQYHQEKLSQVKGRLQRHELKWTTYEDLMDAMEEDGLGRMIKRFHSGYNGSNVQE
jgi:hypothetical protein